MRRAMSIRGSFMSVLTKGDRRLKRRRRVRAKVSGTAQRPRISVFRSNLGLSAQLIDDAAGRTLAAVNWYEPELRKLAKPERTKRAAETLAERAKAAGVSQAVFDRGGYRYHGHVRAFAEAIRESGITV
jgi:large subunit ribosomal protein L18